MKSAVCSIVEQLIDAHAQFKQGTISAYAFANMRGPYIAQALQAVAHELGADLKEPMHIDSRGEYAILAKRAEGAVAASYDAVGHYGEAFVEVLNRYSPRTGIFAGAILSASCGWCYLNHFDAEKLVMDYYSEQQKGKLEQ
jgi:hypothetical protein